MMRDRIGTTILEVLFATGIVIVGLIGIASILPVAIRNSTQSNTSAEGLSLGLAWADSFLVRGLHQPSTTVNEGKFAWVWLRDNALGGPSWEFYDRGPKGSVSTPFIPLGAPSHPTPWPHVAVCIDPNLDGSNLASTPYRTSVFPYFLDNLPTNPSAPNDSLPRMIRIGLANRGTINFNTTPPTVTSTVSLQVISNLFGSIDELVGDTYLDPNSSDPNLTGPDRDALPARRLFGLSTTNVPLRSLTNGQYTWMATITSQEPLADDVSTLQKAESTAMKNVTDYGLVSLLVLHRHDHKPNPAAGIPTAAGERLVEVYPLSGNFVGGAGGRVQLVGHSDTSDQIAVGDWIMLGRYYLEDRWQSKLHRYPFFRWYRIIGISSAPEVNTAGNWTREVVLEGPDFGFTTTIVRENPSVPGTSIVPNISGDPDLYKTYGTLVGGVVTVVERQVKLQ